MGKVTGFLDYNRVTPKYRPVEERLGDHNEFLIPLPESEIKNQGAFGCGIPYCHAMGCP